MGLLLDQNNKTCIGLKDFTVYKSKVGVASSSVTNKTRI